MLINEYRLLRLNTLQCEQRTHTHTHTQTNKQTKFNLVALSIIYTSNQTMGPVAKKQMIVLKANRIQTNKCRCSEHFCIFLGWLICKIAFVSAEMAKCRSTRQRESQPQQDTRKSNYTTDVEYTLFKWNKSADKRNAKPKQIYLIGQYVSAKWFCALCTLIVYTFVHFQGYQHLRWPFHRIDLRWFATIGLYLSHSLHLAFLPPPHRHWKSLEKRL